MTEKDKTDFKLMMGEVLEEVVLPQLQDIRDDVQELKDDVQILKDDVRELKDDVQELKDTTNRIEMRQNAEIARSDQHGQRIERLEQVCLK